MRVIPRDFFNEAKLLKCLGAFEISVLEGQANRLGITTDYDGQPFEICQNKADGSIYVANYHVFLQGEMIFLSTPLNSREPWPLIAEFKNEIYFVFDSDGNWMPNFGVI